MFVIGVVLLACGIGVGLCCAGDEFAPLSLGQQGPTLLTDKEMRSICGTHEEECWEKVDSETDPLACYDGCTETTWDCKEVPGDSSKCYKQKYKEYWRCAEDPGSERVCLETRGATKCMMKWLNDKPWYGCLDGLILKGCQTDVTAPCGYLRTVTQDSDECP
jgi:hypothetical protein